MRHTRLAIVLATAMGSVLLTAAQPPEHAEVNHGLHAAALGAWGLDLSAGQAPGLTLAGQQNAEGTR